MGSKRKRPQQDPVQEIYKSVESIVPLTTEQEPGTPQCFFAESHHVHVVGNDTVPLVIHSHANGLAVVTLGEEVAPKNIKSIEYLIKPAPDGSQAERRKRQGALLKKGLKSTNLPGVILPDTVLVNLHLGDGTIQPVHAGVWGIVVEINDHLTPALLSRDSMFDGYIAIVQPAAGSFPPRSLQLSRKVIKPLSGDAVAAPDAATTPALKEVVQPNDTAQIAAA